MILSDSRFGGLFQGTYYDLAHQESNTNITTGSFHEDFNYDRVLEQAIYSSCLARYVYFNSIMSILNKLNYIDDKQIYPCMLNHVNPPSK